MAWLNEEVGGLLREYAELNGEMLIGPLIWLGSKELNSVGDIFAGTVILYDPNQLLHR